MDKDSLLLLLNEKWKCSLEFGWIPITSNEIIDHTEVYHSDYLSPFIEEIKEIIQNLYGVNILFELNEDGELKKLNIEAYNFEYDGQEYIYTDFKLNFVLYFSHENSTTIGGEKLLFEINKKWPEFKEHLWKPPFG